MEITQINLNGLDLRAWPYMFYIWGVDDIDKDIVTNDMFYDGQSWGHSKSGVKTLTISGYIKSHDNKYRIALNKAIAPNGLKLLILTYSDGTQKVGQVEIQTRAAADSNPTKISLTLVMPDPYWYAQTAKSVQLGATYSNGVVFGPGRGVTFGPKQLITNGDFSKDTNGDGVPDGFVLSNASPVSLAGGEFIFKATAQYGSCSYGTALTPGHRYFICANVMAFSNKVKLQVTKGSGQYLNAYHPGDGAYHALDFVVDIPSGFSSATYYVQDESDSGWQNIGVKDFRAVDMGTASAPTPDYALTADQMAVKYPNYQQEYGGVVFGASTGGAATLTNDGNADAYPVIVVVGTCSGISVTNLTTGETIAVNAVLGDDDTLVIDCRPATCGVYLNGVANIGLKTSPGWMRCVPGDNQIVFSRNSLQSKKHCTVVLNERWI